MFVFREIASDPKVAVMTASDTLYSFFPLSLLLLRPASSHAPRRFISWLDAAAEATAAEVAVLPALTNSNGTPTRARVA